MFILVGFVGLWILTFSILILGWEKTERIFILSPDDTFKELVDTQTFGARVGCRLQETGSLGSEQVLREIKESKSDSNEFRSVFHFFLKQQAMLALVRDRPQRDNAQADSDQQTDRRNSAWNRRGSSKKRPRMSAGNKSRLMDRTK